MSCRDCTGECRQGRDCPHRLTYTDYHLRFVLLFQSIKQWISKITTKR
jgi:hypothetical protein